MGCSYKWTTLRLIILIYCQNGVISQNSIVGGQKIISNQPQCSTKERGTSSDVSSKAQLVNTLLNIVAANGGLPDLLSAIQPSLPSEAPQYHGQTVKDGPKSLNIIQLPSHPCQQPKEQMIVTGKPIVSVSQPLLPSPVPIVSSQPSCVPPQYTYNPTPQPPMYPVNNPINYPSMGIVQPIPVAWHPQTLVAEKPQSILVKSQNCSLKLEPQDDNSGSSEEDTLTTISNKLIDIPSTIVDNPLSPFNLQINLPAQNLPEPKITVVAATPANQSPVSSEVNRIPYFPPFYPPPIIVDSSESLNSWLPLILVALIANDRGCGGGCGCTCCCPCSSSATIPIPYPIPIPINSPIITTSRGSSKVPTSTSKTPNDDDDGDEDEDDDEDNDDDGGDRKNNGDKHKQR